MSPAESLVEICLAQCSACATACLALARRLSAEPADFAAGPRILRLLDCAQACELAIGFIGRSSALQEEVCAMCGEVCETCAETLAAAGGNDDCTRCCRRCADVCFEVWSAAVGAAPVRGDEAGSAEDAEVLQFAEAATS